MKRVLRQQVAWPTILLSVFIVFTYLNLWVINQLWSIPLIINLLVLIGLVYLVFTVVHEASHGLVVQGHPQLNHWFGVFFGLVLVLPFALFRYNHLQHHAFTNRHGRDPDMFLSGKWWMAVIKTPLILFVYLIFFFHQYRAGRIPLAVQKQVLWGSLLLLAMLVFIGTAYGWQAVLLYWWLPAWSGACVLAFLLDWVPHHPHSEQTITQNARNYDFVGARWLLLGQNMHQVHHAKPSVRWYQYQRYIE